MAVSVFAGGSQASRGQAKTGTSRVGAKGSLPLVSQRVTFTVYNNGWFENVTDLSYNGNLFTKKVADETGVLIDFISSTGGSNEQLNAMLSTGNYPDIIIDFSMSQETMNYWAEQGIFVALDQYDIMGYPNIKAAFEKFPKLDQISRAGDGKLHGLPRLNECLHCNVQYGRVFAYIPWSLGNRRKAPETLDEMTAYLRWVKGNDLNGNGRKDEIGIGFDRDGVRNLVTYFAGAFMPFVSTGNYFGISLENNTVTEQYRDSRFRETLKYLAGLYKEGLLLENGFELAADQLKSLTMSADPLIAIHGGTWFTNYADNQTERQVSYIPLAPLKGSSGARYQSYDEWYNYNPMFFVTDKCKDPELAVALYNYLIDRNVTLDCLYGVGNWLPADAGAKGLSGAANPVYKLLLGYGSNVENSGWGQAGSPMIRSADWVYEGHQVSGINNVLKWMTTADNSVKDAAVKNIDYIEIMYYNKAKEFLNYSIPGSLVIPPLSMSNADITRLADVNAVVNPYLTTSMVEFITGIKDISNNAVWNTYLAELDRMGSKEKTAILQRYIK